MVPLGATLGAFLGGPLSIGGRRRGILLANILVLLGCGVTLIPNTIPVCVGRFFYGISSGIFSFLVPKFINEVSPVALSGSLGAIN